MSDDRSLVAILLREVLEKLGYTSAPTHQELVAGLNEVLAETKQEIHLVPRSNHGLYPDGHGGYRDPVHDDDRTPT